MLKGGDRTACSVLGAGEHSLSDTDRSGYSSLKEALEKSNYKTETVKLLEKPEILGGSLESSNVQPLQEMVSMITVSRAYEANQKLINTEDDILAKGIQTLGGLSA